ncbi:MAG TPA: RecX family transcriptional regulator [Anaerolineae bacterium]|nr:RecX family transcriptional regulator [Anaerolineae bacterium]
MAGTITALIAQKKNKDRVNVHLDGEFAFGLATIEALKLKRGQVLSDADIERLRGADDIEKAHEKALRFLANRPRSAWEVRQNLVKAEFDGDTIDRVMNRLTGVALIDDAAFVRYWLDNRAQFNPRGQVALRQELRRKGVDRAVVDEVLAAADQSDDQAAVQSALAKADRFRQLPQAEFAQKLSAYLLRRGFNYEAVREAVEAAWSDRTTRAVQDDEEAAGNYSFDTLEE